MKLNQNNFKGFLDNGDKYSVVPNWEYDEHLEMYFVRVIIYQSYRTGELLYKERFSTEVKELKEGLRQLFLEVEGKYGIELLKADLKIVA